MSAACRMLSEDVSQFPKRDPAKPLIVVVGADGFVGGGLANALRAERVVYGTVRNGDTHIGRAREVLGRADVVINCGGFRVRPGCTYADYQSSHEGSTSAFISWLRKGSLLIHMSSASVLGSGENLGNHSAANPTAFPSPAYALAKLEEECFLEKMSIAREFRVIFLRPAVLYSAHGGGMVETLIGLARRGISLRIYPGSARQHLACMSLLAEVAARVIRRDDLANLTRLMVADPYTVTNRELEDMIGKALEKARRVSLPLPAHWMSGLLRCTWHSRYPRLDLKTYGEIFGVIAMDTVYDPSETFSLLGIDPSEYSIDKTLKPVIDQTVRK